MKIQAPTGLRDFYPDDMRLQNWLFDHWRNVSLAFGFEEYEGPIFESLDLYTLKSGDAIVSELFNFEDRGGRRFAIRPEMTPTLARMVAARANALPRPIKWFSLPRMCRAERPQRGRLREFFQWNVDTLGLEDPLADAEIIAVAAEFFRRVGLGPGDVQIGLSSRTLIAAVLETLGVARDESPRGLALIDRIEKLPAKEFDRQWAEAFPAAQPGETLRAALTSLTLERCNEMFANTEAAAGRSALEQFREVWRQLELLGAAEYCAFDVRVVRGLAYYTGIVFEARLRSGELRALLGGGRYDDLTGLLDGPRVPGVGFGMGDAPMIEALRSVNRLPQPTAQLDVFVIDAVTELFPDALRLVGELRRAGLAVDFSFKRQALGKQLKQAASRPARYAVIVGEEFTQRGEVVVKALGAGDQRTVPAAGLAVELSDRA